MQAPLHFAATCSSPSHIQVCTLLVEAGADVNTRNYLGDTPLHKAVVGITRHSGELVKMLLKAGADIEFKNRLGRTPLHKAFSFSQNSHSEQSVMNLEILIKSGANINATDNWQQAALLSVIPNNAYVGYDKYDIGSCISAVTVKKIKILLEAGANPNARNWYDATILHLVVDKILTYYIEYDLDISKCLKVMSLVLAAGGDPTITNRYNQTAKDIADRYYYSSFKESGRRAVQKVRQLLG